MLGLGEGDGQQMQYIDINSDLGEGYGIYRFGSDDMLMNFISSANIACGVHAGDPSVMRTAVQAAVAAGVKLGAHPSFPDRQGFGRRFMEMRPEELYDHVLYQLGALQAFAQAAGERLHHVKPHGALYNAAAVNRSLAQATVAAARDFDDALLIYAPFGSVLAETAGEAGLRVAYEVFADRRYEADGTLTPRSYADAMIHAADESVTQVVRMVQEGVVVARTGETIAVQADTVCIHGDGEHAISFAQTLRQALTEAGVIIRSPERT